MGPTTCYAMLCFPPSNKHTVLGLTAIGENVWGCVCACVHMLMHVCVHLLYVRLHLLGRMSIHVLGAVATCPVHK